MKITCQACAAKYTIADDKVQGKIVKIRCKKCGATIVVNGNDPSAAAGQAAEPARFDYAGQGAGDQWTVNVADGDQRTLTDPEIVDAYHYVETGVKLGNVVIVVDAHGAPSGRDRAGDPAASG